MSPPVVLVTHLYIVMSEMRRNVNAVWHHLSSHTRVSCDDRHVVVVVVVVVVVAVVILVVEVVAAAAAVYDN